MRVPRCLTIGASDSGGGAGIQADIKAFAAAGCYGTTVIVGVTAQNTRGISAVHEVPEPVITAQLEAVWDDIGADAAKTGALLSGRVIDTVADFLQTRPVPLVVDPVLEASTGARLLDEGARRLLVARLFPLARVITPNLIEARTLSGADGTPKQLAERLVQLGARAVVITGGHGDDSIDHLYDGADHIAIPVERSSRRATHGSGCTHSATMAAELAKGHTLLDAARVAGAVTAAAIEHGLTDIGAGEGPVDVGQLTGASQRRRTK